MCSMLHVQMPRWGNPARAAPWPTWSLFDDEQYPQDLLARSAYKEIHDASPHALWMVVPPALALVHDKHRAVEVTHGPSPEDPEGAPAKVSHLVEVAWLTSWLASASWISPDSRDARAHRVASLVVPPSLLRRTYECLVDQGLHAVPVDSDPALWRRVQEIVAGGAREDRRLEWGRPTEDQSLQLKQGARPVSDADVWSAGMERLSLHEVIGDETSLHRLGLLFRVWGPRERTFSRDGANFSGAFYESNLALVGRENLAGVRAPAGMSRHLANACETVLPEPAFWPARWRMGADFEGWVEAQVEFVSQARRFRSGSKEDKEDAFLVQGFMVNALDHPDFSLLKKLLCGDQASAPVVGVVAERYKLLVSTLAPGMEAIWFSSTGLRRVQEAGSAMSGLLEGAGDPDTKIAAIVALYKHSTGVGKALQNTVAEAVDGAAAGGGSVGSQSEWATLISSNEFRHFVDLCAALKQTDWEDTHVLELMLRSNIPVIKRYALVQAQGIPTEIRDYPHQLQMGQLEAFLCRGRTHAQDKGPNNRSFDTLHRAFDKRIKEVMGLEDHVGSLHLPPEEVVKLAQGKYEDVHLEKIVGAVLLAVGRQSLPEADDVAFRHAIPEWFDFIEKVGASIFEVLGHGPSHAPGSFAEVYSVYASSVREAMTYPAEDKGTGRSIRQDLIFSDAGGARPLLDQAFADAQRVRAQLLGRDARIGVLENGGSFFLPPNALYETRKEEGRQSQAMVAQWVTRLPSLFASTSKDTVASHGAAAQVFGLAPSANRNESSPAGSTTHSKG
jgi:hypothetical protein